MERANNCKGSLFFREWCLGCFVLLFVFILCFFARFPLPSGGKSVEKLDEKIRVVVLGEVARPGVYEVRPGISLGDVVRNAGVLPGSDLRKLYGKKIVISSCSVRVEKKDVLRKVKKRATKKEKMG